jgi:hypothetical protein
MARQGLAVWPQRRVWLVSLGIVAFLFVFFVGSVELLHYTESTPFCTSCHSMDPEKTVYQISPHQNVGCGTCHIGPGALPAVESKIAAARYLYKYPLNLYERPIPSPITSLRPVDVVCEQCHWPQKFYADRLVEIKSYAEDESNTLSRTYLLMKTGGGVEREGLGKGIHWHIEAQVRYRATDRQLQDIPWVQVEQAGQTVEYVASDTQLTPEQIEALPVRKMDCLDCHNRATHVFRTPADAIDHAAAAGALDMALPYLKREGVRLLEPFYGSQEEGAQVISRELTVFYAEHYPDADAEAVAAAARELASLYGQIKFPDMKTDWQAHPNNIGHTEYPGCFRCHDGQHFNAQQQSIRLECNICHNIPQQVQEGQPAPLISPAKALPEPASHLDSNWMALHRTQFDSTCSACHDTSNAGGSDNTSFCANSVCHGVTWKFAGLDAPGILKLESPTQKIADRAAKVPHPIVGQENCQVCHGQGGVRPYPADHAGRSNDICLGCHEAPPAPTATPTLPPAATVTAPDAATPGVVSIPHTLEGRSDCLLCHGAEGIRPYPSDHEGRTNATCTACHQPEAAEPESTATVAVATAMPGLGVAAAIPHPLEGRADCLLCHSSEGIRPYPADHAGRTNPTCTVCHQQISGAVSGVTPTKTAEPDSGGNDASDYDE